MRRIHASKHWLLDERPDGVLLITRTAEPYASSAEITRTFDDLLTALGPYRSATRPLLCDIRAARGRSDPEYYQAAAREPEELAKRFMRAAILVRTAVGEMQARRSLKGIARRIGVFASEEEALAFLKSDDAASPVSSRPGPRR